MSMFQDENVSEKDVAYMQPLVLAMIGDAVQTLFVREYVAKTYGYKINKMNKVVSSVVNAGSQFKTYKKIEDSLTQEEIDISRRARNSHIHTKAKNFSCNEYMHATALEALFGYLYLTGKNQRLTQILNKSLEEIDL